MKYMLFQYDPFYGTQVFKVWSFYGTHVFQVWLFYGTRALLLLSSQNSIQTRINPKRPLLLEPHPNFDKKIYAE